MQAVIFDLWLTLIPFPADVRADTFRRMSEALALDPDDLRPHWTATRAERETMDLRSFLERLGRRLTTGWSQATIEAAIAARMRSHAICFADPFPDGREAIHALRRRNVTVGLVSNCTSDVRLALVEHGMDRWFDEVILSAEVGVMKPAPEIYTTVADRLGIDPAACLYVGDGSDDELIGAASAGMTPILYDCDRANPATDGLVVSSHLELLAHVDRPSVDRPGEAGAPGDRAR